MDKVIEICCIPEHLLDECKNRESYVECDISFMAIRAENLEHWQKSKLCKPPGEGERRSCSRVQSAIQTACELLERVMGRPARVAETGLVQA